jgi:hypothetical protein
MTAAVVAKGIPAKRLKEMAYVPLTTESISWNAETVPRRRKERCAV